jgi:hypothetical protein
MRLVIAGAVALLVATVLGCEGPRVAQQAVAGCGKDTDCKGDRICESGRCITPPSPMATVASVPPTSTATTATAPSLAKVRVGSEPDGVSVTEDGVELCSSTPCDFLYKGTDADPATQHSLTFARTGYRPQTRIVKVGDSPVSVKLIAER